MNRLTQNEVVFYKHVRIARAQGITNARLLEILHNSIPILYTESVGRWSCKKSNMTTMPTSENSKIDLAVIEKRIASLVELVDEDIRNE